MNLDFSGLENGVVQGAASIVMLILVVRLLIAYQRHAWGEMISELAFVATIGWVVWFNDSAEATLRAITGSVTGALTAAEGE